MKFGRHRTFKKQFRKLSKKVQDAFARRASLFLENQFDELLHNHKLHGAWSGYRSIHITGDIRVIFKELSSEEIIFVAIGTHSALYGK